jgi:hypothetical protein
MRNVLLNAFTKLGQDGLSTYTNNVISEMTTDPQFAGLDKPVAALKQIYDAYVVALANNVNGGRVATMEKNKCKKDLTQQLSNVATLVDLLANGDDSIVMSAGFDVRKDVNSYEALVAPDVLKITNESIAGLVTVQLGRVVGATNYGVEKRIKTAAEDAAWQNGEYSSALKFQVSELTSGKTYQFQFRAIGNKGLVSPWSSMVEVLVS